MNIKVQANSSIIDSEKRDNLNFNKQSDIFLIQKFYAVRNTDENAEVENDSSGKLDDVYGWINKRKVSLIGQPIGGEQPVPAANYQKYAPNLQMDTWKLNEYGRPNVAQANIYSNLDSDQMYLTGELKAALRRPQPERATNFGPLWQYIQEPSLMDTSSPVPTVPSRRLSLALLAAYLQALYPDRLLFDGDSSKVATFLPSRSVPSENLPVFGGKFGRDANDVTSEGYHIMHFFALIAAILAALVTVKLFARGSKAQILRRHFETSGSVRSLWRSSASSSNSIEVNGSDNKQAQLGNANLARSASNYSTASTINDEGDKKSLDLLTQKLLSLLTRSASASSNAKSVDRKDEDEEEDGSRLISDTDEGRLSKFRSSRSYIKSLIDVLSKTRSQTPLVEGKSQPSDFAVESSIAKGSSVTEDCASQTNCDSDEQQEAGIAVSQMDISAAHLILAYMEKHLEDKERLRREWRELQLHASASQKESSSRSDSSKVSHSMLHRLTKVALSDENRQKNRNSLVVPYDRNRVKLHSPNHGLLPFAPAAKGVSLRRTREVKESGKQNDYINASYIYDDDPRRPTHIIAQGPTEQTVGQFWQMVWESGISVIVMLTRLNENSVKMCHCYWPTSTGVGSNNQQKVASEMAADENIANGKTFATIRSQQLATRTESTTSSPPLINGISSANSNGSNGSFVTTGSSAANGRRGSVTSVFNTVTARHNGNGQPIIADGDLGNNILCFDISYNLSLDEEKVEEETNSSGNKLIPIASDSLTSQTVVDKAQKPQTTTRFEVHLVSEHVSSNDYLIRNMYMINRTTGETRTITQFHYLAWPEGGVPESAKSFLQFRRKVHKSYRDLNSPILVHCSDGAGRSGTYTLVDIILERIKNGAKEIDPRATLEHLRDQRVGLCGTQSQFEFVLMALAEEIQIILNALPQ